MAYTPEKYVVISHFKSDERPLAEAMFERLKVIYVFADHFPTLTTHGEVKDKLTYVSENDSDDDLIIAMARAQFSTRVRWKTCITHGTISEPGGEHMRRW